MAKITRKKSEPVSSATSAAANEPAADLSMVADDVLAGLSAEVDSLTQMIGGESSPAAATAAVEESKSTATQVAESPAESIDALADQMLAEQSKPRPSAVSVDISRTQVSSQKPVVEMASPPGDSADGDLNADELSAAINELVQQTSQAVDAGASTSTQDSELAVSETPQQIDDLLAGEIAESESQSDALADETEDGTLVAEVIDDTPSEADSSDVDVLDQAESLAAASEPAPVEAALDDTQAAIDQMLAGSVVPPSASAADATSPSGADISDLDDLDQLVAQTMAESQVAASPLIEDISPTDIPSAEPASKQVSEPVVQSESPFDLPSGEDQEIDQLLEEELSRSSTPAAPAEAVKTAAAATVAATVSAAASAVGTPVRPVAKTEAPVAAPSVVPAAEHEFTPAPSRRMSYADSLVVHHQRSGKTAERYRALRTSLLALHPENRFSMLVTSAEAGEGKSVTCVNLALTLAEISDRRTIIVDGCLRASSLGRMLGITGGSGLADVLADRVELDMAIQSTNYKNLFVLPAGSVRENQVPELIGRGRLRDTCDALRHQFDFVLFDVPPILSISDPGIFGQFVHESLLVVRMNKTPQRVIDQTISHLRAINVTVCGVVLTHYRPALPRYLARFLQG